MCEVKGKHSKCLFYIDGRLFKFPYKIVCELSKLFWCKYIQRVKYRYMHSVAYIFQTSLNKRVGVCVCLLCSICTFCIQNYFLYITYIMANIKSA